MHESTYIVLAALLIAAAVRPNDDDRAQAEKIKQGDAGAFRTFFERYQQQLYESLIRSGLDNDAARDILQQAFITLWEKRSQIDPGKSIRALLFRIAWTRSLNYKRDQRKFDRYTDSDQLSVSGADTEEFIREAELKRSFRKAVDLLPQKRKETFELCFIRQFTYAETAEIMQLSVKTVENQMVKALAHIREQLKDFL